jgi:predicted ribosomally synthesized peptide with nif11-like leader
MSEPSFDKFRASMLADPELWSKLNDIDDKDEFVRSAVQMAAERGFTVNESDIREAINAGRRAWIERWI